MFSPVISTEQSTCSNPRAEREESKKTSTAQSARLPTSPPILSPIHSASMCRGFRKKKQCVSERSSMGRRVRTVSYFKLGIQTIRGISKDKADISAHAEESCHWGDKVASEQFRERLENLAATMSRLSRDETHHFSPVPDSEDSSKSSSEDAGRQSKLAFPLRVFVVVEYLLSLTPCNASHVLLIRHI